MCVGMYHALGTLHVDEPLKNHPQDVVAEESTQLVLSRAKVTSCCPEPLFENIIGDWRLIGDFASLEPALEAASGESEQKLVDGPFLM